MNIFISLIVLSIQIYPTQLLFTDTEKCYGDLGCFPIYGDYFHPVHRPLTANPNSPEEINTTFHLFTRKNPTNEQYINRLDPESIHHSNFNYKNKVKFIIHGATDNIDSGWMRNMSQKILQVDDVNVIIVDWSKGATLPRYDIAIANARVVGRQIGNLIKLLKEDFNVKYKHIHLIGHSIGAHVAGHAGEWLKKTVLGQITGLDPGGIFYDNMKPTVRLDPTDALFVDVIHTNGRKITYTSLGMYNATGHVDFYPDGGANSESCKIEDLKEIVFNPVKGVSQTICSHAKSIQMYTESIDESNPFAAYACDSFESYRKANCYTCERPGHDCTSMGYYSNRYDHKGLLYKKFYLTTNEEGPLCVFTWVVEIVTLEQQKDTSGNFYLLAEGKNSTLPKERLNTSPEHISPNKTYTYLLEFEQNPDTIQSIEYSWTDVNGIFGFFPFASDNTISIRMIKMIPMYLFDKSDRLETTVTFCDDSLKAVKTGETVSLNPDVNC